MPKAIFHLFVATVLLLATPGLARAEGSTLIRDAEIETDLKGWARPVMLAAGLDPDAVRIVLVQSPDINAFVAGGQNIFIYTGLIDKSQNAGEVLGVMAHEMGHIAGGHLVRSQGEMEKASYEMVLGTLVGIGAALATGNGQAAMAVTSGVGTFAQRNLLAHSRTQEASADQAAVRFLKTAGINPSGLVTFMQKLVDQELLPASQQNEYVRTHPISRDRVEYLESSLGDSPLRNKPLPAAWADQHARIKAKLLGFIMPQQVVWTYPDRDKSIPAEYARAIAAYRMNHIDEALSKADSLIAREPQNPYFHELKGQMLYDFGRVGQAVAPYARAVSLAPDQPLIKLSYAQALIETPNAGPDKLKQAASLLEQVKITESRNPRVCRQLGIAYGRLGREGEAQGALAEEAFLQGRFADARSLGNHALKQIPAADTRARRRVQDLLDQIDQADKKKKE